MGFGQSKEFSDSDLESLIEEKLEAKIESKLQARLKAVCDEHKELAKPKKDSESDEVFQNLKRKHEALIEEHNKEVTLPKSVISDKAVDAFVQKLIDDPNVNIYGFPDKMEKALYNKMLKTILHAVAHVTDESAILLFGHKIRIFIEPLEKE